MASSLDRLSGMSEEVTTQVAALSKAAEIVGGQAALAKALGYKDRRNVWPWFNQGAQVPADRCPEIERLTGGAVRCEDLRPDIPWSVLRGALK